MPNLLSLWVGIPKVVFHYHRHRHTWFNRTHHWEADNILLLFFVLELMMWRVDYVSENKYLKASVADPSPTSKNKYHKASLACMFSSTRKNKRKF